MSKNTSEKLYDVRVVKRNLATGLVSEKEYKDQLKSLPDLEGEYEVIDLDASEEEAETAEAEEVDTEKVEVA